MIPAEEIAARLKTAADAEIGSINYLERLAATANDAPNTARSPAEVRRQAEALGEAHRVMLVLSRRPDLAARIRKAGVVS